MAKPSDALVGLMLALVGIGILVAWKSGAIKGLLGGADYTSANPRSSERAERSGISDVLDRMPGIPPAATTIGPRPGRASSGLPDDGHSATIAPLVDVWAAGGFLDESSRAARRSTSTAPTVSITEAIRGTAPRDLNPSLDLDWLAAGPR